LSAIRNPKRPAVFAADKTPIVTAHDAADSVAKWPTEFETIRGALMSAIRPAVRAALVIPLLPPDEAANRTAICAALVIPLPPANEGANSTAICAAYPAAHPATIPAAEWTAVRQTVSAADHPADLTAKRPTVRLTNQSAERPSDLATNPTPNKTANGAAFSSAELRSFPSADRPTLCFPVGTAIAAAQHNAVQSSHLSAKCHTDAAAIGATVATAHLSADEPAVEAAVEAAVLIAHCDESTGRPRQQLDGVRQLCPGRREPAASVVVAVVDPRASVVVEPKPQHERCAAAAAVLVEVGEHFDRVGGVGAKSIQFAGEPRIGRVDVGRPVLASVLSQRHRGYYRGGHGYVRVDISEQNDVVLQPVDVGE
jgi:hypothetical protein